MTDPIVEEVRKYRDEHARKFNYDLNRICDDFRKRREECLAKLKNCRQPEECRCPEQNPDPQHFCVAEEPAEYKTKAD